MTQGTGKHERLRDSLGKQRGDQVGIKRANGRDGPREDKDKPQGPQQYFAQWGGQKLENLRKLWKKKARNVGGKKGWEGEGGEREYAMR